MVMIVDVVVYVDGGTAGGMGELIGKKQHFRS